MEPAGITLVSSLVGALVGGGLTAWTAKWTLERTSRDLEVSEVRRLKVDCSTSLSGLRFLMTDDATLKLIPLEYKARISYELNRVLLLWSDEPIVLKRLREFFSERSNERFLTLIKAMAQATKVPTDQLSDADLEGMFSMFRRR
jgi:hypothetical protein